MKNKTDRMLDNLEKIIGVLGVSLLGMISYLFVNIDNLTDNKMQLWVIGAIVIIAIMALLVVAYMKFYNKIKD